VGTSVKREVVVVGTSVKRGPVVEGILRGVGAGYLLQTSGLNTFLFNPVKAGSGL